MSISIERRVFCKLDDEGAARCTHCHTTMFKRQTFAPGTDRTELKGYDPLLCIRCGGIGDNQETGVSEEDSKASTMLVNTGCSEVGLWLVLWDVRRVIVQYLQRKLFNSWLIHSTPWGLVRHAIVGCYLSWIVCRTQQKDLQLGCLNIFLPFSRSSVDTYAILTTHNDVLSIQVDIEY
jgi:hypothetical protein